MVKEPTRYAEALLTGVLGTFGLDVDYVRAEKNSLYYLDDTGAEVPVLDLVGGWGSLMLGHNHPEIVAYAKELLDARWPVHSQHSAHPVADQVGAVLNGILGREFPGAEPYSVTFANSGAEAVEAAVKHCEFDRALRMKSLFEQIEWNADVALNAVLDGSAALPDDTSALPGDTAAPTSVEEFGALLGAVAAHNIARAGTAPVFFALERAFHGKLIGSTQFTYNPVFRAAFTSLGMAVKFVSPDDATVFENLVAEQRTTVLDVEVVDGRVTLVERDFPVVAGLIVEPIQGEGGIHELDPVFVARIREICDEVACPIVVDEIQTGMGRTGKFFASADIGLFGDYYLLGKSLGGGIGKTSALLIRQSRYRPEFELVHSSTFAKDGFSTAIALRTLELLEAENGAAYDRAAERGARIIGMLRELAETYPDVVADVRGKGLLIGLDFADQSDAASPIIREKARAGLLVFQLGSYLQLVHHIRTGPTASVPTMLRIEPSIYISDEEIEQLRAGLTSVCEILRNQDALPLVHPLTGAAEEDLPRAEIRNFRPEAADAADAAAAADRKAALVSYPLTPDMLREIDPSLADLDDDRLVGYARRSVLLNDLPAFAPVRFDSPQGTSVDLTVYPLLVTQQQLREYRAAGQTFLIGLDLDRRVRAAKADGNGVVGLGFGLGAVSDHGSGLRVPGVSLTAGSALAVGSALAAVEHAATEHFGGFEGLTVAVVGGGGRIGSALGALSAERAARIVLVGSGRDGSADRLRATEHRIYQEAWARIAAGGELTGVAAALSSESLIAGWLAEGRSGDEPSGEAIAAYLGDAYDTNPYVFASDDLLSLRNAQVVFSAHSSPVPVLDEKYLADGAVVGDLSFFAGGAEDSAAASRGDLHYVRGGILSMSNGGILPRGFSPSLAAGELLAGMAETVALAMSDSGVPKAGGPLTRERVEAVVDLAKHHGFVTISP
ncbi:aminotransferase class III-fold pyridoxal phosphate-dependent enzyme [Streptomyces sp. CA-278952]|uniref:aminotransferase class III-fold pyridoxal phosphate-dependent enzyme n=1 Tax=unclassified Streptomyces TaxID=2593676 RepID=UPI002368731E|nr:aminotransferase class III-fold pyridoxal phosphate-dependent enzyme [Streptomyces sp. CA-278952]WDG31706.1 aminotransferase class III-fold pyridoxal phosphate-dependent enzyme [Streptomyces sp. CA-278952]